MLIRTQGRWYALMLGALLATACGDEELDDYDGNSGPIVTPDTGVISTVDASTPPATTADTGTTPVPPVNNTRDTGTNSAIDAGQSGNPIPQTPADAGDAGAVVTGDGGSVDGGGGLKPGMCCPDGDCICRGDAPAGLTRGNGQYMTMSYSISAGLVFYPVNAEPPFAAVALADGLGGSGGRSGQTAGWGPFYASHGIVAIITTTGSGDQPQVRGMKLGGAIAALKAENTKSGGPLFGKLAGRYGTSGYSMGGGGTTHASAADPTLKTSVGLAAWQPTGRNVKVPTLFLCGASDSTAPCSMSSSAYGQIAEPTPKMWSRLSASHIGFGSPTIDGGKAGQYALAFQKVFLEGDTRWRSVLLGVPNQGTNIK